MAAAATVGKSPTPEAGPEYHYFRAPYPILSFLFGLYCDAPWSSGEYEKWERAGKVGGKYAYERYLEPYLGIPAGARKVITFDVPQHEPEKAAEDEGRRKPTPSDNEALWGYLASELTQPPDPRIASGDGPYFFARRPVLSALACIYLGDSKSIDEVIRSQRKGNGVKYQLPTALLEQVIRTRGTPDVSPILEQLKPLLFAEFIASPASW